MKLTCKKCRATIEVRSQEPGGSVTRVTCPSCKTRYRLRRSTPAGPATDARTGTAPDTVFDDGEVVAERYRIVRFLARGGMGEVYEAEDLELCQRLALKTIAASAAGSDTTDVATRERFKREIALARTVTHPNVCRIFDLGQHQPRESDDPADKITFLTMELLAGETLAERLARRGRLSAEEALPLVRQMAAALEAAHAARVVHRDFKSENVLLAPAPGGGERVVVTDFGVARGVGASDRLASRVTGPLIVGTPAYMAPEQLEGKEVTPATDLYALGVVLYEMLAGRLPFEGENPLTDAVRRLQQPPPPPSRHAPDIPPHWERAILRCLERHPERRFASLAELVDALAATPAAPRSLAPEEGVDPHLKTVPLYLASSVDAEARATPPPPRSPPSTSTAAATSTATATPPAVAMAASGGTRRRGRLLLALAGVALVAAALVLYNRGGEDRRRGAPRPSVAVLGLRNLTGDPQVEWLSTALREMLTTELARGAALRAVPGERVAQALRELVPQAARDGDPGPETLARLRPLLGCDYVVDGSYARVARSGESTDDARAVRIDLRLVDAAPGEAVASTSRTGVESEVLALVAGLGADLRDELGTGVSETNDPLAGLPTDPEAARLYAQALDRLRDSRPEEAAGMLADAARLEPESPLVHSALSSAWKAQGYVERAAEAARRAFELSSHLPREDRLAVEGRYREMRGEHRAAAGIYRTLYEHFPDDLELGLRLVAAESASGRPRAALATVAELRRLGEPMAIDPRLDLAEATAAALASDVERQLAASSRAASRAEALGAGFLVAQARLAEAQAYRFLGRLEEAERAAAAARELFERASSPAGAALARTALGNALLERGEHEAAAEHYRQALAESRQLGDRGGAASALNNLALVARRRGELEQALELYEEAASIYRETGDDFGLANTLNNLGVVQVSRERLAEAGESFARSREVWEKAGERGRLAYSLNNAAAVLHLQGLLWQSREMHEQALEIRREIGHKSGEVASLTHLARVLADLGELETAAARAGEALELARRTGERAAEAEALEAEGKILLARGEAAAARARLEQALGLRRELGQKREATASRVELARAAFGAGEDAGAEIIGRNAARVARRDAQPSLAASALAVTAVALARQKRLGEARQAITLAVPLAESSELAAVRLEVALAEARVRATGGEMRTARARLGEVEREADRLGYAAYRLEAILASGRLLARSGDAEAARTQLATARAEAEARGLGRLAREAAAALESLEK